MATKLEPDIATLQADIQLLRAQFAKLATTMREKAEDSTKKVWIGAQRQAQQVGQEIEERPIASALTAFGVGVILGLLLSARRG